MDGVPCEAVFAGVAAVAAQQSERQSARRVTPARWPAVRARGGAVRESAALLRAPDAVASADRVRADTRDVDDVVLNRFRAGYPAATLTYVSQGHLELEHRQGLGARSA